MGTCKVLVSDSGSATNHHIRSLCFTSTSFRMSKTNIMKSMLLEQLAHLETLAVSADASAMGSVLAMMENVEKALEKLRLRKAKKAAKRALKARKGSGKDVMCRMTAAA